MTISLKPVATISGWIDSSDNGLILDNKKYSHEDTIALRDYLVKHIKY